MESIYKFYMQECSSTGMITSNAPEIDLENYAKFNGLKYSKVEGLNKIGKPRIYMEEFSDSDRLRVHIPKNLTNSPTTVKFTFYFLGDDRYKSYDNFVEYVRKGFKRYYDTARRKYLYFCANEEIAPAKEQWYGSNPYLELQLNVQNIFGRTFDEPII